MNELCDIRDVLLSLYNDLSLLVDAIERDKFSEIKYQFRQILNRRDADYPTWDFEDSVIEHIDMRMIRIFDWDAGGESNE